MDPNACLERFWKAVQAGDFADAWYAQDDLGTWLRRGGHEPTWSGVEPRGKLGYVQMSEAVRRVGLAFPELLA